jgi:hypothetical protein
MPTITIMKNKLLAFIFAVALIGCSTRQEPKQYADYSKNSDFNVANVDSVNVENLEVLAKVWGFAKYHHPAFADPVLNADYELFELLSEVAYAGKEERNDVLSGWIEGLGEFKSAEKKLRKEIAENGYTTPSDIGWLEDEALLGPELSKILQRLRWAKRPNPSRYASLTQYGHITFDAESGKGSSLVNDIGYNLLTLFRLWNMAEYYFPSVNITDKKWADVLSEYIPKFLNAADSIKWTTAELITELSDTHSRMPQSPIHSDRKLPVELNFAEGEMIVTNDRKYLAAGEEPVFKLGDKIVSIGGRTPDYFVEHARKYIAASNENQLLYEAARLARNVPQIMTTMSVEVRRRGRNMKFDIASISSNEYNRRRSQWVKENQPYYKLLNKSVGYIYPGKYKGADNEAIMEMFANTKGIVVDMRCYPSDFMPFQFVGRYFVPDYVQHVTFTKAVCKLPGYFYEIHTSLGGKNDDYYKGNVVVLVNAQTLSQAEYTTMAFQVSPNCLVIGSQTAGADGNVVATLLPYGIMTGFSGLGVFYPDGTNTQRVGVRIDHYVEPTIEGIRTGRDEVLEKALEIISQP